MTLSSIHMNAANCFNLQVLKDETGRMLLTGYLTAPDGTEHSAESGIILTKKEAGAIADMKLHRLKNSRWKLSERLFAYDKTVRRLTLCMKDGRKVRKELTDGIVDSLLGIFLDAFRSAERPISRINDFELKVWGMRASQLYELVDMKDCIELSLYNIVYRDRGEVKELERCVRLAGQRVLELLEACNIRAWSGFSGNQPKDTLDGKSFRLYADLDVGIIEAEGTENFPYGYRDMISAFDRWLRE